jgi:hypothetical protein
VERLSVAAGWRRIGVDETRSESPHEVFYTRGIRVRGAVAARFPYRVGARRLQPSRRGRWRVVAVGGEGERRGEGGVDAEWRWESVALSRRGAVVEGRGSVEG